MIAKFKKMLFCLMGFLCSVFIFSISSMPSYAAENSEKQTVSFNLEWIYNNGGSKNHIDSRNVSFTLKSDFLVLGCLGDSVTSDINGNKMTNQSIRLMLYSKKDLSSIAFIRPEHVESYSVYEKYGYEDSPSEIIRSSSDDKFPSNAITGGVIPYTGYGNGYDKSFGMNWSGFKLFKDSESLKNYLKTGNEDGLIEPPDEPETDINFYLKNVRYRCYANDSSEHEDETFVVFEWDTDNLKKGDLIEVKTRSYYKSLKGDVHIGFNDYITKNHNKSAYTGSLELSQTAATKAWWQTVENKPLIFKSYDTDMYFIRPVRGNIYGGWVRITMGRKTPTSSPHVEDIEWGDFNENGDWIKNEDATINNGGNHGFDQNGNIILPDNEHLDFENIGDLFSYFFNTMKSLILNFGQLPTLINSTIGFLPSSIISLICASIVIIIILRIIGR